MSRSACSVALKCAPLHATESTPSLTISLSGVPSAREVALDYLRAMGYKRDEIIYYGADGVSWRGAVYRARPVETNAG